MPHCSVNGAQRRKPAVNQGIVLNPRECELESLDRAIGAGPALMGLVERPKEGFLGPKAAGAPSIVGCTLCNTTNIGPANWE